MVERKNGGKRRKHKVFVKVLLNHPCPTLSDASCTFASTVENSHVHFNDFLLPSARNCLRKSDLPLLSNLA